MDQEEKNLFDKTSVAPSEAGDNQRSKDGEEQFEELQKFSSELIKLGQEIGEKFKEKERILEEISEKEKEARVLQTQIFDLKDKLVRVNVELSKLEQRRKQLEGD